MQALILCWIFLLCAGTRAQDYCSVCIDHTMCRFGDNTGRACGKSSEGGVTDSEIQTILELHNDYRRKVATGGETKGTPGPQHMAANMQALVWDEKLAEVAQRWADQCTLNHDKCRDDPRFPVGQNIYYSSGLKAKNWTRAVEFWYQEVKYVNSSLVHAYDYSRETGHYTQLVWAKSRYVGCARRSFAGKYRPRADRPVEYVLGEARSAKHNVNAEYFGENIREMDLLAAMEGAITSNIYENSGWSNSPLARHAFDPKAAQDTSINPRSSKISSSFKTAVTKINVLAKSTNAFNYKPPQSRIPVIVYPHYKPYYPTYSQYLAYEVANMKKTKETLKDSPEESSEDSSSDESSEEERGDIVIPTSLQFKSWTNNGWKMIDYDLSIDQIYICNYGPAGNFIDEPIYIEGAPCTKCPSGTTDCRNGLCI